VNRTTAPKRKKFCYVGPPAIFKLQAACQHINDALGSFGCYVVGSCLERPDFRDVDVRFIMEDGEFENLFPAAFINDALWEHDPRWLLFNISITEYLRVQTGLPVDFQIQPQTFANEKHPGKRYAIGLRVVAREKGELAPGVPETQVREP